VASKFDAVSPTTLPTLPVTLATALAATAVPIEVFMVAVKIASGPVLFVRSIVAVVIVPAVDVRTCIATDVG
jgi:hypothetical protein